MGMSLRLTSFSRVGAQILMDTYQPEQTASIQAEVSNRSPWQSAPPLLGDGYVHDLDLVLYPVPHVCEQADQSLQQVSPPSMIVSFTIFRNGNVLVCVHRGNRTYRVQNALRKKLKIV